MHNDLVEGSTAIVIVTYQRPQMLKELLLSIDKMVVSPQFVVVIDNNSADDTESVVANAIESQTRIDIRYEKQSENLGGAGGFNRGVELAVALGAEWLWLMDDDVEVLPNGLQDLLKRSVQHKAVMGRRRDYSGNPYFFQTYFNESLGIHLPQLGNVFAHSDFWQTNLCSFEGFFFHRSIVEKIGLPDPRFFITWDDVIYGWLTADHVGVAYVDSFVMERRRNQKQIDLGIRHLAEASDLSRYYVMRNRGHVAQYLKSKGKYNPALFSIGTMLTLAKEIVRLILVERKVSGFGRLVEGMLDARKIIKDKTWRPMPPLELNGPTLRA